MIPVNQRRERLRAIARQELLRRTGRDEDWSRADDLRKALNAAWPTQQPIRLVDRLLPGPSGKRRRWTVADQLLVDEANSILNGPPAVYGHVVVDEAQDHSAVGLRVIGRRSTAASMTLVGDVAQSTTPAGQERWADIFRFLVARDDGAAPATTVAELTIGYRVPEPILTVANRLLPRTGVDASASRSVRAEGHAPAWVHVAPADVPGAVAAEAARLHHHHRLTGVVAPLERHDAIAAALHDAGWRAVDHLHELAADEIPLFGPEQVKGLEFDGVVVVEPDEILGDTSRGARLLYVAMTRAVQELAFVTPHPDADRGAQRWRRTVTAKSAPSCQARRSHVREAVLEAQAGLADALVESLERELTVGVEARDDEAGGHDVGGDAAQHVGLRPRGEEDHDVAGQHRAGEGLGLAHRRQVEVGEVGGEPAGAGVVRLGGGDQLGIGVDADDGVATLVEHGADAAWPAPGVEDARPGRQHGVDEPGFTAEVGPFGGHRAEALDVPLRVPGLRLRHPARRPTHAPRVRGLRH